MLTHDTRETKICIWCRHHKMIDVRKANPFQPHATGTDKVHACMRFMSLITGEAEAVPCETGRIPGSPCGPQGALFQPLRGVAVLGRPFTVDEPKVATAQKKSAPQQGGFTIHLNGFEQLFGGAIEQLTLPEISDKTPSNSKRKRTPKDKGDDNKETV
jgi:hypothetical protein